MEHPLYTAVEVMDEVVEGPRWVLYLIVVLFSLVGVCVILLGVSYAADGKHRRAINGMVREGKLYTVQGLVLENYISEQGSYKEYVLKVQYNGGSRTIKKSFKVGKTEYRQASVSKQVSIDVLEGHPKSGQIAGEKNFQSSLFFLLFGVPLFGLAFNGVACLIIIVFLERPVWVFYYWPALAVIAILGFSYYSRSRLQESVDDYIRRDMEGDAEDMTSSKGSESRC